MPALFTYPLYHTPFLEEGNSITENFIIISLKFFCIHAFIDLAQGFVAVVAQFFKCFRILRLENRHSSTVQIIYNHIASSFAMLTV